MTAERDGKSRRTGQPDLLASLPDERPAPGIDSAAIEELLTGRNLSTILRHRRFLFTDSLLLLWK